MPAMIARLARLPLLAAMLAGVSACAAQPASKSLADAPAAAVSTPRSTVVLPATQPATQPLAAPTDVDPKDTLPYLASDQLEGRGVGTAGLDRAADFLASEFQSIGLQPLPGQHDYFQPFQYTASSTIGPDTSLSVGNADLVLRKDFSPLGFSANGKFDAPVVFVGYGITSKSHHYDDYAGIDVKGKVVLAMRFEPVDEHGKSRFGGKNGFEWSDDATFASKAKAAADHGAAALLLVTPPGLGPDMLLPTMATGNWHTSIPVIQIKQPIAEKLLADGGAPAMKQARAQIDSSVQPRSLLLKNVTVRGEVDIRQKEYTVKNVIGYLPGTGSHADEYVIVGAHYDHLGKGQLGHMFGPVGSIYHGADDNASGTAAILNIASDLAKRGPLPRSIVFISFTAEEEGLIGSAYFVAHPLIPLDKVVAMINLDMVGRLKDQKLFVGGDGTAQDFEQVLTSADQGLPLKIQGIGKGGLGPSDHMTFALKKIPVLFFFTGLHADYHRPTDVASKVNYDGIHEVVELCDGVVTALANLPKEQYVTAADAHSMTLGMPGASGHSAGHGAVLGVVPDYSSDSESPGVLLSGVREGTPAAKAGLAAGDTIVGYNDQKVENLQQLFDDLSASKPGDTVALKVLRGKETLNLKATLAERKESN